MGHNTNGYGRVNNGLTNTKKFDENEINEAKEHLKLLKMKLSSGTSNDTTNGFSSSNKTNSTMGSNSNNNNYRKPFKPFSNDYDNNEIKIDTGKKVLNDYGNKPKDSMVNNRNNSKSHFTGGTNNTYGGKDIGKPIKAVNNKLNQQINIKSNPKTFQYEEIEDDRPAINQKGSYEYIIIFIQA